MSEGDIVGIANGNLAVEISTLGAEMQSLRDGQGRDLQWDGDPAVWNGHAPILFPVIGLLAGGAYRLDGRAYAMPKHGFARHSIFEVVAREADRAVLRLAPNAETRACYPFDFRLDIAFELSGASLSVRAEIANRGDGPMPASFGFHPALRWPLPAGGDRAAHRLVFPQEEPAPIRRIGSDGLLKPAPEATPVEGGELVLRDALFVDDAVIFDQLESRSVRYGAPGGAQIDVAFADFPILGVWTKPGAGYVCIEPWHGLPDPAGYVGDIFDKPGIMAIAPGTMRSLTMTITLTAG